MLRQRLVLRATRGGPPRPLPPPRSSWFALAPPFDRSSCQVRGAGSGSLSCSARPQACRARCWGTSSPASASARPSPAPLLRDTGRWQSAAGTPTPRSGPFRRRRRRRRRATLLPAPASAPRRGSIIKKSACSPLKQNNHTRRPSFEEVVAELTRLRAEAGPAAPLAIRVVRPPRPAAAAPPPAAPAAPGATAAATAARAAALVVTAAVATPSGGGAGMRRQSSSAGASSPSRCSPARSSPARIQVRNPRVAGTVTFLGGVDHRGKRSVSGRQISPS